MSNIHIKNKSSFDQKVKKLKDDGLDNLHLVSDFDRTLTKSTYDGEKVAYSYQLLRDSSLLDPEFARRGNELFNIYYPIEIATDITKEEKNLKMQEWWDKHYDLMIEYGVDNAVLDKVAQNKKTQLRDQADEVFSRLSQYNVPFLIFSAGLGDIIERFLRHEDLLTSNVHIISNFFLIEEGKIVGAHKPFIHPFSKNEVEIKKSPYYQQVKNRKNVILLGDSLGDLGMTEGIEHDTILRVGYLNFKKDELLEEYMTKFDVVITDDGSMEFVNNLLKEIGKHF